MADNTADAPRLTAEQYRKRAKLERNIAAAMGSRLRRQELLSIARQYDELADIADRNERARSSG
jgi:hypothetical protein